MDFSYTPERIYMNDISGMLLAEVTFPLRGKNVYEIDHTFVDPSLEGRGIGSQLVEAAVKQILDAGGKARPTCPFAVYWFRKHPEYSNALD